MTRTIAAMLVPMIATAAPVVGETAANYSFTYTYPSAAAQIPGLRAWLEADRARLRAKTAQGAARARVLARRDGSPFLPYETRTMWLVVTETPRFLSLSSDTYAFTGGAHGSSRSSGLVWDKAAGQRLTPVAVFVSPAAVRGAIGDVYCERLKAERRRRNGPGSEALVSFGQCPPLAELTLLLGSSDRQRIDRIGLVADPYVAGSFAEGAYEVTLPVTAALLRAVKPEYRDAFAQGR